MSTNKLIKYIITIIWVFFCATSFADLNIEKAPLIKIPGWVSKIKLDNNLNITSMIMIVNKEVYYSCSNNNKNQWLDYKKLNKYDSTSADVVVDEKDNVYLFWIEQINNNSILKLKILNNNCKDTIWEEIITYGLAPQSDIVAKYKNNKLIIAYSCLKGEEHNFILRISINNGRKWSSEKIVHNIYSKNWKKIMLSGWMDFDIGEDGTIYLVAIKRQRWTNGIVFTYSHDNGDTFSKEIFIRKKTLTKNCNDCSLRTPESNIKLFSENNNLYIFYIINKGNKYNIYGIYSKDKGINWSTSILITNKFSFVNDYAVLINENHIDLAFYRKDDKLSGLYYTKIEKNSIGNFIHSFIYDYNGVMQIEKNINKELYIINSEYNSENKESMIYRIKFNSYNYDEQDQDKDGIPDNFEDKILKKFKPHWYINSDDPAIMPVRLKENSCYPEIEAKDGSVYGQVFRLNRYTKKNCKDSKCNCTDYYSLEIHYYNIWEDDKLTWPFSQHEWDKEHMSAHAIHNGIDNPFCTDQQYSNNLEELLWDINKWKVDRWQFYAHEGTLCEKEKILIGIFEQGIDVWVSYKHGIFPSKNSCNKFLRFWCPDACFGDKFIGSPDPINIGEVFYPLNGATWTYCNNFLTDLMDPDLPLFPYKK